MSGLAVEDRCLLCWDEAPPDFLTPALTLCHEDCWRQYEIDNNGDPKGGA